MKFVGYALLLLTVCQTAGASDALVRRAGVIVDATSGHDCFLPDETEVIEAYLDLEDGGRRCLIKHASFAAVPFKQFFGKRVLVTGEEFCGYEKTVVHAVELLN